MEAKNEQALERNDLSDNEFGIKQGAVLKSVGTPDIKVLEGGTATVTFTFKVQNDDDITDGPKTPDKIPFPGSFGGFDKSSPNIFQQLNGPTEIIVDVVGGNIALKSRTPIFVVTDLPKREGGAALMSAATVDAKNSQ